MASDLLIAAAHNRPAVFVRCRHMCTPI